MNKKIYLSLAFLLAANTIYGQLQSPQECIKGLGEASKGDVVLKALCQSDKLELSCSIQDEANQPVIYIFNNKDGGFVISSGEKGADFVLGYCEAGRFDRENLPEAMSWLLDGYSHEIKLIRAKTEVCSRQKTNEKRSDINPLLTCIWNQGSPYNLLCPKDENGASTFTGCGATAMAQVLYYHKWPERGKGICEYSFKMNGATKTIHEDLSQSEYQWEDMLDSYPNGGYTDKQSQAVAQLMYDCGVASSMAYGTDGSSTSIDRLKNALIENFGYNRGSEYLNVDGAEAEAIMYHELEMGRPMIMHGHGRSGSRGHLFVCDGYRSDGYFHINWGWGGRYNGYFILSSLVPLEGRDYSYGRGAIVNVHPPLFQDGLEVDYTKDGNASITGVSENFNTTHLVIPSKVKMNDKTFAVTEIRKNAFKGCPALKSLKIPGCIREIGDDAFYGCEQLENVVFEEGTETLFLGDNCFPNVRSITMNRLLAVKSAQTSTSNSPFPDVESVVIGNDVKAITDRLFCQCTKLSSVIFNDDITSIGDYAFVNTQLKDIRLPKSLKSIGNRAFASFKAEKMELPEGLETIGREAFAWSGKLTCLHLPLSIKEIGWYAFAETGGMDLYAHWEMPIRLKEPIKDTLPKTLYVPLGTTDLYKERGWNGFDIKEFDYTDIPTIKGENDYSRKIARFNLNGTLFEPDKKGVCIERLGDGAVRKILIK